jgi:predicted MFS family arabinose efflux permease
VAVRAGAMVTGFFLSSLYLQQVRGLSVPQTTAALLLPAPAMFVSGPLVGRLLPRLGIHRAVAVGLIAAAC